MSFSASWFSKLGLEGPMSSILPQYTSPPTRPAADHSLEELSPTPDSSVLASESMAKGDNNGQLTNSGTLKGSSVNVVNKGKGKMKSSVTIQEPVWSPTRTSDPVNDYRAGRRAYQKYEENLTRYERSQLPFSAEPRDLKAPNAGPRVSFLESMFLSRPDLNADRPYSNVDQSFKLIQRRERQMQKELQELLDAQSYALERDLYDISGEEDSQRSWTPESERSLASGHVVPVRQPKKRHLKKKEARLGIARVISQLSDLKNEEEAYVATALAERKAALSRLRNLSSQRKSITDEMKTIQSDHEQPKQDQIRRMEFAHRMLLQDIEKTEEKLRKLKRDKTRLEQQIQEAKSTMESELSGYRGALDECDKKILDIMRFPAVQVLEMEELMNEDAELQALIGKHISGFEFLALRPERRTLNLAKDWWEGEVAVLELRKTAIDRERDALEEGSQLWQDAMGLLSNHDTHLKIAFGVINQFSYNQQNPELSEPAQILEKQYEHVKTTIRQLKDMHESSEERGWNLLVVAFGAEMEYFSGLKQHLGETLEIMGVPEGVVTPRAMTPVELKREKSLVDIDDARANPITSFKGNMDEELSGSVIRRWGGAEVQQHEIDQGEHNDAFADIPTNHQEDEHSDNEVPTSLLTESQNHLDHEHGHESEDEQSLGNDVPAEFLSMHSPPRHLQGNGAYGHNKGSEQKEEVDGHFGLQRETSRDSSENTVPLDILSESRYADVD
ncbi:hypothetical protein F5Y15DRAFT_127268 [Xylariaceae sp. FL0016]|nr:hypothetical protein F5Y15DRAFT_127268 [Xylariaceae sp. FL0016]